MKKALNVFWFRRDLRLHDNTGLFYALRADLNVLPIFIFDRNILDKLDNKKDPRVEFIRDCLLDLQKKILSFGGSLEVYYGNPTDIFSSLTDKYNVSNVFTNEDYEPYARDRDEKVAILLKQKGVGFKSFKDHVIFSRQDVLKDDGNPYTVFTPYSNKWRARLDQGSGKDLKPFPSEESCTNFFKQAMQPIPDLTSIGFSAAGRQFPPSSPDEAVRN